MENWIRNLDSFYVTKDDQKISFSDDFIKSEERVTGLGKGIYTTYKYFDTYIWKEDSTNHYYFEWIPKVDENILKRFIGRIVLCVKIRMAIRQFLICKVY